ncbi:MAG: hypothetical protein CO182_03575, partial [Lysobacterales bacterium CG_4_9_14_3_um_filter_62_6]
HRVAHHPTPIQRDLLALIHGAHFVVNLPPGASKSDRVVRIVIDPVLPPRPRIALIELLSTAAPSPTYLLLRYVVYCCCAESVVDV